MFTPHPQPPECRWISVAFLQGDQADEVLGIIDRSGPAVAREYLRQRDHGQQTTDAALRNGYVYNRIPAGTTDHTIEDDASPYALTYSTQSRYVSILRRYAVASDWEPAPPPGTQPHIPRHHLDNVWAPTRDRSAPLTRPAVTR
ncbi:hypothetical protein D6T64_01345 [Cryobacterium melibiosiphilum]|uniref:Uncharacterized protein n=1 Tax=Cryobacterium melibiosiphilum TaxID=995039 RepID=A0A3A5MVD8_9MICO|nr:hypothetical protein [Cryobacterium melibiosiphilum]RJT91759.1 hypothetical protein D6T64_01345 [Cryobacterium melibiosiphilum]